MYCKSNVKFVSWGLTQTFVLVKKVCDENRKKDKKRQALHTRWPRRWECDKEPLNEDKRQRFIIGDIDSILIKGTINVLNFRTRGMGMVFRTWAHKRAPLNSQWPVLSGRWLFLALRLTIVSLDSQKHLCIHKNILPWNNYHQNIFCWIILELWYYVGF